MCVCGVQALNPYLYWTGLMTTVYTAGGVCNIIAIVLFIVSISKTIEVCIAHTRTHARTHARARARAHTHTHTHTEGEGTQRARGTRAQGTRSLCLVIQTLSREFESASLLREFEFKQLRLS